MDHRRRSRALSVRASAGAAWALEPAATGRAGARDAVAAIGPANGLGIFLGGEGTASYAGHSGWNEGFICDATIFPELGIGAVAMTNGQNGYELIPEVFRAIAQEYGWPNYLQQLPAAGVATPELLAAAAGEYTLRPGVIWSLQVAGGALALRPARQPPSD